MEKENKEELLQVMISLTTIREKISIVLSDFAEQEMGNRITKYNIQGLANILAGVFQKEEVKGDNSK
jgi:hypothetical protein